MAKKHDVHISKDGNGWKVTQDGDRISRHRTQGNAIDRGKTEARRDAVDLVTHGRDGRLSARNLPLCRLQIT